MNAPRAWGATPDEWLHFDMVLGLTEDLLPVVSNPNAVKSEASKIGTPGKLPSRYNTERRMVGIHDWTQRTTTPRDIEKWSSEPDYGICLQTRKVRAIDVDVPDFDLSLDIEETILAHLGVALPCRRRADSMKFLLVFELAGDYTKRIIRVSREKKHAIEFLATGQQFVALGTHPDGARYEWPAGLPASVPQLAPEQFETLWDLLTERFSEDGASVTVSAGRALTRPRVAADASDEMVDWLYANWTVFDNDRSGRVDILCPFADGHTDGVSEGSSTSYFPAGVGGFDQGHFRCLHASCAHRTDHDYKAEIGYYLDGFEEIEVLEAADPRGSVSSALDADDLSLDATALLIVRRELNAAVSEKTGRITPTRHTTHLAFSRMEICGYNLALDYFREEVVIAPADDPYRWRAFRDEDYYELALQLENGIPAFGHIPQEMLRGAITYTARQNPIDTAIDWLDALKWDGVPRCERFLTDYMAAEDTPYIRAVSLYLWSALAGRVLQPGVKADMVPIAVGDQGARKTSAVAAISPSPAYHGELDLGKDDDTLARDIRGKLVMEIGELKGINRKEIEHLKAFLSRREEKWVQKYKEYQSTYARRCVFFATTNDEEALPQDTTGNRRWLPFALRAGAVCDVDSIIRDRDLLWAEARELFRDKGVLWQEAEALARPLLPKYTQEDSWLKRIEDWAFADELGDGAAPATEPLHVNDVATGALSIAPKDISAMVVKRIAACLKQLGFRHTVRKGRKAWVYDAVKVPATNDAA